MYLLIYVIYIICLHISLSEPHVMMSRHDTNYYISYTIHVTYKYKCARIRFRSLNSRIYHSHKMEVFFIFCMLRLRPASDSIK